MTINIADNTPRVSYSVAAGVTQTSFTVTFEFFAEADLNVYIDGTLKTLTTDYTVTGGDGSTGSITMSVTGASGGSTVVITRKIAFERTTDFPPQGAFQVTTLNTELDRLTAVVADLNDEISRSLRLTDYDEGAATNLPTKDNRKGKMLAFNASTGDVEAGATVAGVTALSAVTNDIETLADIEDGTIATDAISGLAAISSNVTTVASNITNVSNVGTNILHVENVSNNMASVTSAVTNAATANAALATFQDSFNSGATAPTSPTDGDLWYDTANTQLRVYVASTSQWEIAGSYLNALTSTHLFTATASQVSFITDDDGNALSIYTNGNTFVYKNGIRLTIGTSSTNDYYISGNTITLNSGANLNDVILVEVFTKFTSVQEASLDQKVTDAAASATDAAASLASIGSEATDSANSAAASLASQNAAAASETAAAASETASANSATASANSESSASSDATQTAADRVATGQDVTASAVSAAAALVSKNAAAASETQVSTDAAQAAADKTQTAADRVQTGQDVTAAANSATASANSATSASNSASTATTQAGLATTNGAAQVALATTQATNASNSATAAANSASSIGSDATQTAADRVQTGLDRTATTASAAAAASDASQVSTDATQVAADKVATAADRVQTGLDRTAAASSASAAATSQTSSASNATAAANSAASAVSTYDQFDDRYLGSKNTSGGNPTTDNDGNALITGALMWDDTNSLMKVYNGSSWVAAYASSGGALINSNNLSDVSSASSARSNLGLGTAATTASSAYATAAQGTKADAALPKSGGALTGAVTTNSTFDGRDVGTDGTKLDTIETNATADQTASEIRALVESASDSNVFTNADHTKLNAIEASATADQSASEILTAVKTVDGAASGLDADLLDGQQGSYYTGYTDTAVSNLVDSSPAALNTLNELAAALGDDASFSTTVTNSIATKLPLAGGTMTGNISFASGQSFDGRDVSADGSKLDGIEAGATANQTASEILTAIKTVDGASSGLDADLLDGQQGSYYLDYNNATNTPTIPTNNNQLTNGAGYITSVPAQSFSSLTSKPTTISGYGITDAFDGAYGSLTGTPTIPSNNNQLTNGAGYTTYSSNQSLNTSNSPTFATLNATTVDLGAWTVTESSNVLYFKHNGTNKMKIDSSGNLTVVGDVTAFGSV